VALGATLSKSLSTFSAARHVVNCARVSKNFSRVEARSRSRPSSRNWTLGSNLSPWITDWSGSLVCCQYGLDM
jgi:hypothetical protein